jgi:hypothetical protein
MLTLGQHISVDTVSDRKDPRENLRLVRLGLSGALVGVAGLGLIGWVTGFVPQETHDLAAGVIGFVAGVISQIIHLK